MRRGEADGILIDGHFPWIESGFDNEAALKLQVVMATPADVFSR